MKSSVKLLSQRLLITECIRGTSGHILIIFTHSTARCWLTAQFRKTGFMEKYIFKDNRRLTSNNLFWLRSKWFLFRQQLVSLPQPFSFPLVSIFLSFFLKSCLGGCDFRQKYPSKDILPSCFFDGISWRKMLPGAFIFSNLLCWSALVLGGLFLPELVRSCSKACSSFVILNYQWSRWETGGWCWLATLGSRKQAVCLSPQFCVWLCQHC